MKMQDRDRSQDLDERLARLDIKIAELRRDIEREIELRRRRRMAAIAEILLQGLEPDWKPGQS
jgi:hypothetical protein